MAILLLLKLVTVTTAYGSGNAGGIFGPSLFLGAALGGTVGSVLHYYLPEYTGPAGAYALVGMGAAFAGIIRAPMTSVIMIFEITRDYRVIVPLMLANLVSLYVSRRAQPLTVYEALSLQDGIHLPSTDAQQARGTRSVGPVMRVMAELLGPQMTVREALERGRRSEFHAWPVRDDHGLWGMVTAARLEQLEAEGKGEIKLNSLLDPRNFPHVHSDQSLELALERMGSTGLDVLPVVSRANMREMIGVVALTDVMQAYGLTRIPAEWGQRAVKETGGQ
jgi:CIC family chloride channel protein